jgi:hypothetical protein
MARPLAGVPKSKYILLFSDAFEDPCRSLAFGWSA